MIFYTALLALLLPVSSGSEYQSIPMGLPSPLPVLIQEPIAVTGGFYQATQPVSIASPVAVTGTFWPATQTTSASVALVSVQIVAANANRKDFFIWNNSSNSAYCSFAASASSASPTTIIAAFTSFHSGLPVYQGGISCIRNAGSGTMTTTEIQ